MEMVIAASTESYGVLALLLTVVLVFVLSIFLGRWLRRKIYQNRHPDSLWDGTSSDLVLDYPRKAATYASVPLALLGLAMLVALMAAIAAPEADRSYAQILYLAVMVGISVAGSVTMNFSYRTTQFYINSKGVGQKTPKNAPSFVEWDEITELRISPIIPNKFVLVTKTDIMKIPVILNGMKDLVSMLAVKIPRERWGDGVDRAIERSMKGLV